MPDLLETSAKRKRAFEDFASAWGEVEDDATVQLVAKQLKSEATRRAKATSSSNAVKKATNGSSRASAAKDVDWRSAAKQNNLKSLSVAALKDACLECKLPRGGNKSDLIARLEQHLVESLD
jgi:hypothetical protein